MRVRLRYDHALAKLLNVEAITLFPFILISCSKEDVHPSLLKHEMTHVAQIRRDGFFLFHFWYVAEFLWNLVRLGSLSLAYQSSTYEEEAYENEGYPLSGTEEVELARAGHPLACRNVRARQRDLFAQDGGASSLHTVRSRLSRRTAKQLRQLLVSLGVERCTLSNGAGWKKRDLVERCLVLWT